MFLVTDTLTSLENCKIHSIPFLILNDKISGFAFWVCGLWLQKRLDAKKDWMQKKKLAAKNIGCKKDWIQKKRLAAKKIG